MRPLAISALALALFTGSVEAAERFLVATRTAPREAPLRMLRDSGEARTHGVRAFQTVDAFAADLTPAEVAQLKASPDVRFIAPVVERHASGVTAPRAKSSNASAYSASQTVPYGITMVHAPELWRLTKGAGPVNVA